MRVLIAEDDLTSRKVLKTVVERLGYGVVLTGDGNEALEAMLGPNGPRIALLDWEMPGLSGVEVCRTIREKDPEDRPYLIMVTGKADARDLVAGFEAGADDYVTKPFAGSELKARLGAGIQILELQARLEEKIAELKEALDRVRTLEGIVPICMHCKRVRDTDNYWQQVEVYVSSHSKAQFSHGLCEECMTEHYDLEEG